MATSLAIIAGCRWGTMTMPVASFRLVLCAAIHVSQMRGSGRIVESLPGISPLSS